MAFSQTQVADVAVRLDGAELYVSWTSAAPARTVFQVYLDHRLAWYGSSRQCHVPIPPGAAGRNVWVEVGTVAPSESTLDFSGHLTAPGGMGNRARLSWYGGTYLDPSGRDDVQGFRIYGSPAAGAPLDLTTPIDTVAAYPGGRIGDGFGLLGFGQGGFGRSASFYRWTSDPLSSGVWQFAVAPYDKAGNIQQTAQAVGVTVATAPRPPATAPGGTRLTYSYSGPAARQVTIRWLASPPQ